MGSVPIQNLSTGLRCFTGRIHQKIRWDCQWLPQQNEMHRWHMLMGRHPRRELLSNMSLARHMRSTRNCSESRKVCIWLRRGRICWIRHHSESHIQVIRDFLGHKTSLTSNLGLVSSTKYRTATPSATTWHLSASFSSRRQRFIAMISCNMFLSLPRLLYWTKLPRVSGYSTPNVSPVSPQIGPRKALVSGSCRNTAPVRSSILSVAQRDRK